MPIGIGVATIDNMVDTLIARVARDVRAAWAFIVWWFSDETTPKAPRRTRKANPWRTAVYLDGTPSGTQYRVKGLSEAKACKGD